MSESIYDVNGDVTHIHLGMLRLCKGLWNNVVALHTGILLYQLLGKIWMKVLSDDQLSAAHDSPLGCSSCIEKSFLMLLEAEGMRRKTFVRRIIGQKGIKCLFPVLGSSSH